MNILFVVPYLPNLIRVRPYNLIKGLSQLDHHLTVATIWDGEDDHELEQLKKISDRIEIARVPITRSLWNCALALPSRVPLQSVYSWQTTFAKQIAGLASNCNDARSIDVIHVEHLRGVRYGLYLKSHTPHIPVVWDSVDCISHLFRQAAQQSSHTISRLKTKLDLERTARYEGWLVSQFDRTLVTSQTDKQALSLLADQPEDELPLTVLPNGVDLDYFQPGSQDKREPATLVMSGKMSYHANVTMASQLVKLIMPVIWSKKPEVKLWIVGKDPPQEVVSMGDHPNITITGTVLDICPYLQKATVAVAPLTYGAGIQNKVLEAMACATPVVTSSGAVTALDVCVGSDLLVADKPDDFARSVLRLLDDPRGQRDIGNAGRLYVENNHKWSDIAQKLEGIYDEVIRTRN